MALHPTLSDMFIPLLLVLVLEVLPSDLKVIQKEKM